jgi:hypothetical protein
MVTFVKRPVLSLALRRLRATIRRQFHDWEVTKMDGFLPGSRASMMLDGSNRHVRDSTRFGAWHSEGQSRP